MTVFHHTHTPSINVKVKVSRVAIASVIALVVATALLLVASNSSPSEQVGAVADWMAASYFVILGVTVASMAVLGLIENARESDKPQYDIR